MAGGFAAVEDAPAGSVRETPRRTVVRYRTAGVFCVYAFAVSAVLRWGPDSVRMRSLGSAVFEASPEPVGRGWW